MQETFDVVIRVKNKETDVKVEKKLRKVKSSELKEQMKFATKDILRRFEGE